MLLVSIHFIKLTNLSMNARAIPKESKAPTNKFALWKETRNKHVFKKYGEIVSHGVSFYKEVSREFLFEEGRLNRKLNTGY